VDAGQALFVERGYAATTMQEVADDAGVALDTVYAVVGPKPKLIRLLIESAISGTDQAVPAEQREYVRLIRAAPTATEKLAIYARALRSIHARLAPLVHALQDAAPAHPDLAKLWKEIADRRRANMLLFARDLAATHQLRTELTEEEVADVIWSTGAPEFYLLLVRERAWPPERFERWLAESWARLLVA
jgi:AcrR family transcriptional regulator